MIGSFFGKVLIRFNTKSDNVDPAAWRILIPVYDENCTEHERFETFFADNVFIEGPSETSEDDIGDGIKKWHITTYGRIEWNNSDCYIRSIV